MANIEYSETGLARSLEYYGKDECLVFRVTRKFSDFFCLWTPKMNPYTVLNLLLTFGFLPPEPHPGLLKSNGVSYETNSVDQTFEKVLELDPINVEYLRLGPIHNCLIVQQSPLGIGLCCAIGGDIDRLSFLGTALTLTARPSLIRQYHAMHSRLLG